MSATRMRNNPEYISKFSKSFVLWTIQVWLVNNHLKNSRTLRCSRNSQIQVIQFDDHILQPGFKNWTKLADFIFEKGHLDQAEGPSGSILQFFFSASWNSKFLNLFGSKNYFTWRGSERQIKHVSIENFLSKMSIENFLSFHIENWSFAFSNICACAENLR